MIELILVTAMAQVPEFETSALCASERVGQYVSAYGLTQAWPELAELPALSSRSLTVVLNDRSAVLDGFHHVLHVDLDARRTYVTQQGGFAGISRVFGPLPLAACAPGVARQ